MLEYVISGVAGAIAYIMARAVVYWIGDWCTSRIMRRQLRKMLRQSETAK